MLQYTQKPQKPVNFVSKLLKRGIQKNRNLFKSSLVAVVLGVTLGAQLVGAQGPSQNPPFGEVVPNFTEVNINSKASDIDQSYVELQAVEEPTNDNRGQIVRLKTQSLNGTFSELIIGGQTNVLNFVQSYSGVLRNLLALSENGVLFTSAGSLRITAANFALTQQGRLTVDEVITEDLSVNRATIENIDTIQTTTSWLHNDGGTQIRITDVPRIDTSSDGFERVDNGSNKLKIQEFGYIRAHEDSSAAYPASRTSGRFITTGCRGVPADDVSEQAVYTRENRTIQSVFGAAFACGYTLSGDITGGITVRPTVSADGSRCEYQWSRIADRDRRDNFQINAKVLCFRGDEN